MDIQEIKKKKEKLEDTIISLIREFENETTLLVAEISIEHVHLFAADPEPIKVNIGVRLL
jgi:hypothetical protein